MHPKTYVFSYARTHNDSCISKSVAYEAEGPSVLSKLTTEANVSIEKGHMLSINLAVIWLDLLGGCGQKYFLCPITYTHPSEG